MNMHHLFYPVFVRSWDKVDAYEMFLKKKRLFVKTSTTDPCETRKQILKDITGFAAAGELIGILGPRKSFS